MPDTQPVNVQININSNTAGASEASSALGSFGSSLSNILQIATGISLANIGQQVVGGVKDAISQVADFQTATTAMGVVLDNVSSTSDATANAVGGSTSKVSDYMQKMTDALITYNEKVKKINDNIAEVMKGQNVIDAQTNMTQQLDDLADAHAQKVISLQKQITDAQTNETNSLSDMTDSQNNKMADLAEKHAQQMADAKNSVERAALQKKYDEEVQYDNDAFARAYATKKAQLDRNTAQKIASVKDQITQENAAYDEKLARDTTKDNENIQRLKDDNAKKLALYTQELADEKRTYEEHLKSLEESAAKAGGAANSAMGRALAANDPFKIQKQSLGDMMDFINKFSSTSPFNLTDITASARVVSSMQFNFEKMAPIISNIAVGTGQSFGTTTQALMDAVNGRLQMMQMTLGISKEKLIENGAEFNHQGQLMSQSSLFKAFDKLANTEFAGATEKGLHTLNGAMSNLQDNIFKTESGVLGLDAKTGQTVQGGAMWQFTNLIIQLGQNGLPAFQKVLTNIGNYLKATFTPVFQQLQALYEKHHTTINRLGELLGVTFLAALVAVAGAVYLVSEVVLNLTDYFLTQADTIMKYIGPSIDYMSQHWQNFLDFFVAMGTQIRQTSADVANDVINMINSVIKSLNVLLGNGLFQAVKNVLPGGGLIPNHIDLIGNVSGGTPSGMSGGGVSSPKSGSSLGKAEQASGISIVNYNTINNKTDPNTLAKMMGLQVSLVGAK